MEDPVSQSNRRLFELIALARRLDEHMWRYARTGRRSAPCGRRIGGHKICRTLVGRVSASPHLPTLYPPN